MDRPHPLVPEFILKNDAAGARKGAIRGAVLFVDITGFSNITDALLDQGSHGSEVLANFIRAVFRPLIQNIYAFDGFVGIQAGDACTAIFQEHGDPISVCKNAMAAAQRMQQTMLERPTYETPYGSFDISLKIGLAYGDISWGIVESANKKRAAYYFMGPAINQCATAEHQAAPGDIILDAPFKDILADDLECAARGPFFVLNAYLSNLPQPGDCDPPVLDLELASRYYPRFLFSQDIGGEFRQVVHLFISLPTIREEAQLAAFMQTCFLLMDQYGGFLNRVDFGDKGAHLLMFWGAPLAFENDVTRAILFVLGLQSQTAIPINAGITYQLAHAGFIGSEFKEEYTAFGRGVNLAARFMTGAPRGEVWVDASVAQIADHQFVVEAEGEKTFKGFRTPQKVFLLVEQKDEDEIETQYKHNLVGREQELETLTDHVQPIFEQQYAGIVLLLGEAGIGKTRILNELESRLDEKWPAGFQVFRAQCDEILRGSMNPLRFWLRHYFNYSELQIEARNKRNFNRRLDRLISETSDPELVEELDRTRSFIGSILGLHWPDSLYEQLDAESRYENTISGLNALIRSESCRRPILFILEDIHWIDADTRVFLQQLMRYLAPEKAMDFPIAIICTARPERTFYLDEDQRFEEIVLGNLHREQIGLMAEGILQGPASAALIQAVVDKSEGNPLFAEQIFYFLIENEYLIREEGQWQLVEQAVSLLPEDIRRLLTVRIDFLPPEVKEAVQIASVLGREFDRQLFVRVLPDSLGAQEMIEFGVQSGMWSMGQKSSYIFNHALLWEVSYRMQLRQRREELHVKTLAAAEDLYRNNLKTRYEELAYHAESANIKDKAVFYLQKAGDTALEKYQNNLAQKNYSRALSLISDSEPLARFETLLARQEVFDVIGDYKSRQKDLEELQHLAEELDNVDFKVEIDLAFADLDFDQDRFEDAAIHLEQVVAQAKATDNQSLLLSSYSLYSQVLMRQGLFEEGIELALKGLALASKLGDRDNECLLSNNLALLMMEKGDIEQGKVFLDRINTIVEGVSKLQIRGMLVNHLGMLASFVGDYSRAQTYFLQGLEIDKEMGRKKDLGISLGNLGWLAGLLGDFEKADAYNQQRLDIALEIGNLQSEAYSLINLSANAVARGDFDIALEYAKNALRAAERMQESSAEAWALTYLGQSYFGNGEFEAARTAYLRALDIRHQLTQETLAMEPISGLAEIQLACGDLPGALNYVEEILSYLDGGGKLEGTDNPMRIFYTSYRVLAAIENERADKLLEDMHRDLMKRANSITDSEMRKSFLENVPLHIDIVSDWEKFKAAEHSVS